MHQPVAGQDLGEDLQLQVARQIVDDALESGELRPGRGAVLICGLNGTIAQTIINLAPRGFVPDNRTQMALRDLGLRLSTLPLVRSYLRKRLANDSFVSGPPVASPPAVRQPEPA